MSLETIHELWKAIKPAIEVGDATEAAELLVNYLVDNDFDSKEIESLFQHEPEFKKALKFFAEKPEDVDSFEENDDFLDDDDDYFNLYDDEH